MTAWTLEAPMVAHLRPWQPGAGPWVAYRDEPARRYNPDLRAYETLPGQKRRVYLYDTSSGTGTTSVIGADRFATKADALTAARKRWPPHVRGCRIGAERITDG